MSVPFYTPTTPTLSPIHLRTGLSPGGTTRSNESHSMGFPFPVPNHWDDVDDGKPASIPLSPFQSHDHVSTVVVLEREHDEVQAEIGQEGEMLDDEAKWGEDDEWEGLTPLDLTLEKIGMGRYQKTLLVLCGLGWMADNMILQSVAIILPRVQVHFHISDPWIGLLSASIFCGMMIGAYGWGTYSDSKGRVYPFKFTLAVTSLFGLLASVAPSFSTLCGALFGLGIGVGGSMPTDGTLFLENIPPSHHYLLTALSIFFSFGAVLTSALALAIIPRYSCPITPISDNVCDVEVENAGWRYLLGVLAVISLLMFLARIALFKLQESARYLVAEGDTAGAIISLQRISRINGNSFMWRASDVVDDRAGNPNDSDRNESLNRDYEATRQSPPLHEEAEVDASSRLINGESDRSRDEEMTSGEIEGSSRSRRGKGEERDKELRRVNRSAKALEGRLGKTIWNSQWIDRLPFDIGSSVEDYFERLEILFDPKLARTTKLIWSIWGLVSAAYTIFNVFLPKWIEAKLGNQGVGEDQLQKSLEDCLIYTLSGMPGSIIGAYLVETALGRKGTLASSTLLTAVGVLLFVLISSQAGVVISSMAVSLSATLMYAVIYSMTPEIFPTRVRGTACGIASALSRLTAMLAPLLTGVLLAIHHSLPLYISAGAFFLSAGLMISLPAEARTVVNTGRGGIH